LKTLSWDELFCRLENIMINILPPYIKLLFKNRVPSGEVFRINETGLLQVLLNLIINARHNIGGRRGYVEVTADIKRVNKESESSGIPEQGITKKTVLSPHLNGTQKFLKILVKDDGPEIPFEKIKKIFDSYITNSMECPETVTGLSLSIVYSVLESMGAGFEIVTDKKIGTSFLIYFPVAEVEESEKHTSVIYPHKENTSIKNLENNKRILLVDDEYDMRLISKRLLERKGYQVILASNGEEALKVLDDISDVGLIIVDYHMPGMEGRELIKSLSSKKSVPMIVMTGDIPEGVEDFKEVENITGVIQKPLEMKTFLDIINKAME